jgi:hypothetical protein
MFYDMRQSVALLVVWSGQQKQPFPQGTTYKLHIRSKISGKDILSNDNG